MIAANRHKMPMQVVKTLVAVSAAALCLGASAADLPAFTFNPGAVGLAGASFTADNLLLSNYATVTATPTGFTETGYLAITSAQLDSTSFLPSGLTSTYGLYISFNAVGTNGGSFSVGPTTFYGGTIDTLSYTLYGYNGAASFSPTSAPTPLLALGGGSLESGTFGGTLTAGAVTSATASITVNFAPTAAGASFFGSPAPFFSIAQSAFNNTASQITNTPTGFIQSQGGGSINFVATPVPEPETYAMLLAGLGLIGSIAIRRNKTSRPE